MIVEKRIYSTSTATGLLSSASGEKFYFDQLLPLSRIFEGVWSDTQSELEQSVLKELCSISEIAAVYLQASQQKASILIVTDDFSEEARMRIYEREGSIIDSFPKFDFDFNVIYRGGRSPEDLVAARHQALRLIFSRKG